MRELKHLNYRGSLRSCNYHCGYCPFSKQRTSSQELAQDQAALERLTAHLTSGAEGNVSVLITPYGEALIHAYYWQALAQLTASPYITAAGAQTNLSFSVEAMLDLFQKWGGQTDKLRLWCTFHGSMTTVEAFTAQCRRLSQRGIPYSVGAVGDPTQLTQLTQLRAQLPAETYLWINRLDGLKRSYTAAEQAALTAIDPYFLLEVTEPAANMAQCIGGRETLFVRSDGTCTACNLNSRKLGNLYDDDWSGKWVQTGCRVKGCHCQMAYANRLDIPELILFNGHPAFRQPILDRWRLGHERQVKAIFVDIDGTLTDQNDRLKPRLTAALPLWAKDYPLYLATERPYSAACHLLGDEMKHFSGGVFADGGEIRPVMNRPETVPLAINDAELQSIRDLAQKRQLMLRQYQRQGQLYRLALWPKSRQPLAADIIETLRQAAPHCRLTAEGGIMALTAQGAGKWPGMLSICQQAGFEPANIAYLANSASDAAILKRLPYGIAVANAEPEAHLAAKYWIND